MSVVYLAVAIDQVTELDRANADALNAELVSLLATWGHSVYSPRRAWNARVDTADVVAVDQVNRFAIRQADVLVAVLGKGVASVGVPAEIEIATSQGKLAIVLGDDFPSVVLDANPRVRRLPFSGHANGVAELVENGDLATLLQVGVGPTDWVQEGMQIAGAIERAKQGPQTPVVLQNEYWNPLGPLPEMLPFVAMAEQAKPPARHYSDDAGFDLVTSQDVDLAYGGYANIPCGVAIELPSDTFGWVVARSSTFNQWGVIVLPGIIDAGYRGELMISAFRPSRSRVCASSDVIPAGTRLGQLLILPNLAPRFTPTETDVLSASQRSLNGWGSSGV